MINISRPKIILYIKINQKKEITFFYLRFLLKKSNLKICQIQKKLINTNKLNLNKKQLYNQK